MGEMPACGTSTITCYFVLSSETDEDLFSLLEKLDHQCKRNVWVSAGSAGEVVQERSDRKMSSADWWQFRLLVEAIQVLVSCGNTRSPPTILQIFVVGLGGVLGSWCQ